MVLKYLNKLTARFGYQVIPEVVPLPPDIASDETFVALYNQVKAFTMTSPERLYSLYQSVHYVVGNNIPGDFVECGVWKGGSCMMMALVLKRLNVNDRKIYLYDTFEGMSEPTADDKQFSGEHAGELTRPIRRMKILYGVSPRWKKCSRMYILQGMIRGFLYLQKERWRSLYQALFPQGFRFYDWIQIGMNLHIMN